jgi:outer membrane protein assembly factor BamE (lipoprotein component of BamABCDE complex)
MKAILSLMVVLGLMTGCSTSGRKVSQADAEMIRAGDTKQDVQARIGVPDEVSKNLSGETWTYQYRRSSPNAKRFIPLLGTFIGGKNVETQTVTVKFDQDGRVQDLQTAYGGTDAKGRPVTGTVDSEPATTTTP